MSNLSTSPGLMPSGRCKSASRTSAGYQSSRESTRESPERSSRAMIRPIITLKTSKYSNTTNCSTSSEILRPISKNTRNCWAEGKSSSRRSTLRRLRSTLWRQSSRTDTPRSLTPCETWTTRSASSLCLLNSHSI